MSFLNLKRRLVCLFILLCLCGAPVLTDRMPAVTVTAQAASKYTGWKKKSGKYYYYKKGKIQKNWLTLSGKLYYLGSNGVRRTGFFTVSGKRYYANGSGVVQKGTFKVSGKTYYASSKGVISTGWHTISGKTFYADGSGARQTGLKTIGGLVYYFYPDAKGHVLGEMATGWQTVGGLRYYFYGSTNTAHKAGHKKGAAAIGWESLSGRSYYFLNASQAKAQGKKTGAMATGWQTIGGARYYFYGSDMPSHKSFHYKGALAMGWESLSGRTYYFLNASEAEAQGKLTGAMATGWQTIEGKTYYFYEEDGTGTLLSHYQGTPAIGWQTIEGKEYYFDTSCALVTNSIMGTRYLDQTGAYACDVVSLTAARRQSAWTPGTQAAETKDLVYIPAGTILTVGNGYELQIHDMIRIRDFGPYTRGITTTRDIFARISIRKADNGDMSGTGSFSGTGFQTALASSSQGKTMAGKLQVSRLDPADYSLFEVAHRGGAYYGPENTMTAFRNAVAQGYRAVETDIRFTSDGVPVLLHDPSIDRVSSGTGLIEEMTLEEARSYDYADSNEYYENEEIADLEEFLSYATEEDILSFLELKEEYDEARLALLNQMVLETGSPENITWLTWDYHTNLERMNQIADMRSRIAVLTEQISESVIQTAMEAAARTGRSIGISANQSGWTRQLFDQVMDGGLFLSIWTVNSNGYAKTLMSWYSDYLESHGGYAPEVSLTTNGGTNFAAILTAQGMDASLYERKEAPALTAAALEADGMAGSLAREEVPEQAEEAETGAVPDAADAETEDTAPGAEADLVPAAEPAETEETEAVPEEEAETGEAPETALSEETEAAEAAAVEAEEAEATEAAEAEPAETEAAQAGQDPAAAGEAAPVLPVPEAAPGE